MIEETVIVMSEGELAQFAQFAHRIVDVPGHTNTGVTVDSEVTLPHSDITMRVRCVQSERPEQAVRQVTLIQTQNVDVVADEVVGDLVSEGNAEFIAHAPQDVADLLAELERLRASLEEMARRGERDGRGNSLALSRELRSLLRGDA